MVRGENTYPDTTTYDPGKGRSIFHGSLEHAQELIDKFAGSGTWLGSNRERIDFRNLG